MQHYNIFVFLVVMIPESFSHCVRPYFKIYPRGFAASESSHVVRHAQMRAEEEVRREMESGDIDYAELKTSIRSVVGKYVERKTGRRPIVLPVVMSLDA